MTAEQKLWRLRLTEKILVALILIVVSGVVWGLIFAPDTMGAVLVWPIFLIGLLLLAVLVVQNVVDGFVNHALTAAKQSNDQKFRSLYEQSPTSLITVDPKGTIVTFNPAAARLLDSTLEALGGRSFYSFIITYTGHDVSVLGSKIESGITLNDEEISLRTETGNEIWVRLSVYEDKQNQQRIISMIDSTLAKKIDNAKSEFVALATHQLRTPIAAIRWNVELLQKRLRQLEPEGENKYLTKIDRNVMRMIMLIDDFLSVSKLETGTFAAQNETFDLTQYLDGIVDEFIEKINQKEIKVTRHEDPPNFQFTSDSRLFHIITSNLISNSVKYLRQGGTLEITYEATHNGLVVKMADDGIGIPQRDQAQLFNRFFRASNAREHQTQGTGLGLYIVKRSVEQLGGTIEVTSTENVGTVFTVTLPIR